jgi:DNA modification methylase
MAIIDQKFGRNWVSYNADCVFGMRELPDSSIDFQIFSPPFLALYIYSDSIADLGNTDSEEQFFDGWRFHLEELYRILKSGKRMAIHCKDTMRYMSSHGYAGLYDFPGQIIRLCEEIGFSFERWVTIWKDPVVEMQRTKTYGLLHKSFSERGEVTRQGCADYVLIFNKDGRRVDDKLPDPNPQVIERMVQIWTNEGEYISTPLMQDIRGRLNEKVKEYQYSFFNLTHYSQSFIKQIQQQTTPGRLTSIHCTQRMMVDVIQQFENVKGWKFHSRLALTDGSYVVTFRNWKGEFENKIVKHNIQPPDTDYQSFEIVKHKQVVIDGETETVLEETETWRQAITRGNEHHPDYVGNNPPVGWRDRTYYSILLWQRYASPVWFDLDGLPESHQNCWMNIQQTDVLNYRKAKSEQEEKHICPLQLDLIKQLLNEYTQEDDIALSPYAGIGSEGYQAIRLRRKAILFELKPNYWRLGCKHLVTAENEVTQQRII